MSSGACFFRDWLDVIQPEHVFAHVLQAGSDTDFFWETVRQFARIEGCTWARTMFEQNFLRELQAEDLAPYFIHPDGRRIQLPMGPFGKEGQKTEDDGTFTIMGLKEYVKVYRRRAAKAEAE